MAAEKSKDPAMYVKRDGVLWLAGWLATKQTVVERLDLGFSLCLLQYATA